MSFFRRLFGLDEALGDIDWSRSSSSDEKQAPAGKFRVCAYHIDFDDKPTYHVDVDSRELAVKICDRFGDVRPENVDYAVAYDERGERVAKGPW